MEKHFKFSILCAAIVAVALAAALVFPRDTAAQPTLSDGLRGELRLSTTGEWQRFPGGGWNVKIYGDFSGGASATMETRLLDGSVVPISCPDLVAALGPTQFVFCMLAGEHRIKITGGTPSINWEARRVE